MSSGLLYLGWCVANCSLVDREDALCPLLKRMFGEEVDCLSTEVCTLESQG